MPYVEYDEVEAMCSDCGRAFRSEDALAAHREDSHTGQEESNGPVPPSGLPVCPACHARLPSSAALQRHVASTHPAP
jgi:hypothetical protein